ncbi:hypothetical protein [Desulfobacter vibrioformis]|uniref:hypothetical protein n=1 Tax=Desulfobacter vibrioformis TaxID=34031 RepID=UPI0005536400|nr:hypothetical protein [Desulfobacter vibrioformis]
MKRLGALISARIVGVFSFIVRCGLAAHVGYPELPRIRRPKPMIQLWLRQNRVKHIFSLILYTAYPALYDIIIKCDRVPNVFDLPKLSGMQFADLG